MKKFLLSLFAIFSVLATVNAESYTHTFKKGELTTDGGAVTLSDIEWSATGATYIDWNTTKGIQIGSKNNPNTSYTLSTSEFAGYKIKSVTVNSSIAASGDATANCFCVRQKPCTVSRYGNYRLFNYFNHKILLII